MSVALLCTVLTIWKVDRFVNPLETSLTHILVFGPQILALTEDGSRMLVWDTETGGMSTWCLCSSVAPSHLCEELQTSIQFEPGFTAIMIHHPPTYLNKVLVASSQGSMQLWNIRTQYVDSSKSCGIYETDAASLQEPFCITSQARRY